MEKYELSTKERLALRSKAHKLHTIVMIGQQGLTNAIITETNHNFDAHELIKVQIANNDRDERLSIAQTLCSATNAQLIQHIGKQLVLYRPKKTNEML